MTHPEGVTSRAVHFAGSSGDQLAARLDLPVGLPLAFAIFAHCFTCSKDVLAATRISRGLVEEGFAVLRFDFTGLGASEGEFSDTNFSSNVEDLVCAAAWLREHHAAPSLLVGHSLGGAAVLAVAARLSEVTAVATIGAPFDPAHVAALFTAETLTQLDRDGEADVTLAGRTFKVRSQLLNDLNAQNLATAVRELRRALLVFHSPIDDVVGVDNARRIYDAARHPKSFVSLDGADHLLTRPTDTEYVARVLGVWARRYVPVPDQSPSVAMPAGGEGVVRVSETGFGAFQQQIRVGGHVLTADEPLGVGDDTGPSPYDFVLAGLGACTSMTLRMFAGRRQWPLEHVSVQLTHSRVHSDDCRDPNANSCMVDSIERTITLTGLLSEDQRKTLLEIADKCPVHRTLVGDLRITTKLAGADVIAPPAS